MSIKNHILPEQLSELKCYDQFVAWRYRIDIDGNTTKPPCSIKGGFASHSNPDTWCSYDNIVSLANDPSAKNYDGIGFVMTANDPFCMIDLDDCFNGEKLTNWAEEIVNQMKDQYVEISPSKQGLKIICKGSVLVGMHTNDPDYHIGVYSQLRYFCITGDIFTYNGHIYNNQISNCQDRIDNIIKQISDRKKPKEEKIEIKIKPKKSKHKMSNTEILARLNRSQNNLNFKQLYYNEGWEDKYNSDHSSADAALIADFAFYTQDHDQLSELFEGSGLYRSKWEREDYKRRTIDYVLSNMTDFFEGEPNIIGFLSSEKTNTNKEIKKKKTTCVNSVTINNKNVIGFF